MSISACSQDNPCLNYGVCKHVQNSRYCKCHPGFYGTRCENKMKGFTVCGSSSQAKSINVSAIAGQLSIVTCPDYQKCYNATYQLEKKDGEAIVNGFIRSCVNATYCVDLFANAKGQVEKDNTTKLKAVDGSCCDGDFCNVPTDLLKARQINFCRQKPCSNGGTCIPKVKGYTCNCPPRFKGEKCQYVDHCSFKPCKNKGTCRGDPNNPDVYTCVCLPGYQGDRCEQAPCFWNNMYPFGPKQNDNEVPENDKYGWMCLELRKQIPVEGIEFYGRRHKSLSICRNGIILFGQRYTRWWPYKFGQRYWFDNVPIIAPFWSMINSYMAFRTRDFFFRRTIYDRVNRRYVYRNYRIPSDPKRQSRVYYQLYSRWNNNIATAAMLNRSSEDVRKYAKADGRFKDFKASFVVVVTWVNLYPNQYNYLWRYFPLSNTFQAVIITDGRYTFTMFNYPCGGIQWAVPLQSSSSNINAWYNSRSMPTAGWNSGSGWRRNKYYNIKGSGKLAIAQLSRLTGNTQEVGRWFFRLEESTSVQEAEKNCYTWYQQQSGNISLPRLLNNPCPCSLFQARRDGNFPFDWRNYYYYPSSYRQCYLLHVFLRPRIVLFILNSETNEYMRVYVSLSQRCCYSTSREQYGSLLEGPRNGGHARLELYIFNRYNRLVLGFLTDEEAHRACCKDSNLCHLFYEKRPSDSCNSYRPPRRRWFWGDPHIVTMDNKNYTFNGLGEYIMADVQNGFFQLQARTVRAKGDIATVFASAVAKEQSTNTFEVRLNNSGGLQALVNGSVFDFESITNGSKEIGNVSISREENNGVSATFPSGISVTFSEVKGMMTIVFGAPESFKNKTRGLLGVWNDDPDDDFTLPDGSVLPVSSNDSVIHYQFGLKWQITAEQSLFTYEPGQGVDTFKNTSYTPLFADELKFYNDTLEVQAREVCGSNLACLFDAAVTKDVSVGEATLKTSEKLVNESNQLENFPPELINASSTIKFKLNEMVMFNLTAKDKNGDPIIFMWPSLAGLQAMVSNNTLNIKWTLSTTNKVNFTVVVRDSKGASVIWNPTIMLCACQNGGNCTQPDNLNGDKFQVMSCTCGSGYTGKLCESNLDACDVNGPPCFPGVNCTDLAPPKGVDGYVCGPCPVGYAGNGSSCTDIDECQNDTKCSQLCINTPGSFSCQCNAGYKLNSDGSTCDDIDECQMPDTCMHTCSNTIGSYKCTCNQAFKVDPANPNKCVPVNGCDAKSAGCQHVCYLQNNEKKCSCHKGYTLDADKKNCKDLDECKTASCSSKKCNNFPGGYNCLCPSGFRLASDKTTCDDINECVEGNNCSDPHHQCINNRGSYECKCEEGLYWINGSCKGIGKGEEPPKIYPQTPRPPSNEEKMQSIIMRILDMLIKEWVEATDKRVKKVIATLVSSFCKTNKTRCGLPPDKRSRRAAGDPLYTEHQVHLLPSYPKQNGSVLLVAFYVQTPPGIFANASAVPALVLEIIISNGIAQIQAALNGKNVTGIRSLFQATPTPPPPPTTTSPPTVSKEDKTWMWIVIGVCCGVVLLLVIVIIVVVYCKKKNQRTASKIQSMPYDDHLAASNRGYNNYVDGVEMKKVET